MSQTPKSFWSCPHCKSVFLLPDKDHYPCPSCNHPALDKLTERFILRCRTCGLTQNKNSFIQLHGESKLQCQASNCSGQLKVISIGPRNPLKPADQRDPLQTFNVSSPPPVPGKRKLAANTSQEAAQLAETLAAKPKPKIKKSNFLPFPIAEEGENLGTDPLDRQQDPTDHTAAEKLAQSFRPFPAAAPPEQAKSHAGVQPGDILELNAHKFEILERIGTGGMGAVHKAKNVATGDLVAVKEFYYSRFHDPESGNNFCEKYWNREAAITKIQSESPEKSMKCLGELELTGFQSPEYYIFLEYIEGIPLDVWYAQHYADISTLTVDSLREMIQTVLMPITRHMYYCHQKGIVHRDLTVQNIMIVNKGEAGGVYPVIIDWGVAKQISLEKMFAPRKPYYVAATPEATGIRNRGTPPEVMAGFEPIATTDIYMLGHIMFFLFSGGNYAGAAATNEDFVLHPGDFNPQLPEEFNKLVEYMTQYEPADRMADMVKVYDALQWLYETSAKLLLRGQRPKAKKYFLYCDYNQGFLEVPPKTIFDVGREEVLQVGRTHDMDGHIFNALLPTSDGKFSFQIYIDNDVAYLRDIDSPMGTYLSHLTMPNQQVYDNVAIKGLDNVSVLLSEANIGNMVIEVPFVAPDGKTYRIPFKIYVQEAGAP